MGYQLPYILRHSSGRLSYRRAYPDKIREHISGHPRELKVSLGRHMNEAALQTYHLAQQAYERIVQASDKRVEDHNLPKVQISNFAANLLRQCRPHSALTYAPYMRYARNPQFTDPLTTTHNSVPLQPAKSLEPPKDHGNSMSQVLPCLPLATLYAAYAEAVGVHFETRKEGLAAISKLCAFMGHDDAIRLTTSILFDWRDHLLTEIKPNGKKRTPRTVQKQLSMISACLSWAVDERKLSTNVAKLVRTRIPKKRSTRDKGFTQEEASTILLATLQQATDNITRQSALARRWIPWLCAYTGARVNKISQLRREDVRKTDNIWCIRITPEAGTVKTNESRMVPLHPHLIEQGFITEILKEPSGPIFYDPSRQRTGLSKSRNFKKVGERLAQWIRHDVGIKDPAIKPNHAWRHRFKTVAYDCGIEERLADAIQGHAPKSVGQTYGTVSVKAMHEAIRRIPRLGDDQSHKPPQN